MDKDFQLLLTRVESLLVRVEALFPAIEPDPDWKRVVAARWRKRGGRGFLPPVLPPAAISMSAARMARSRWC
jgi:predicted AAA+ superfamily ATPase